MNVTTPAKTLLAFLLLTTAACAQPVEAEETEAESTGTTASALTCQPTITAAAITKQIVSVDEPTTLTVELVTVTAKPYRLQATGLTFPAGFLLSTLTTTSCIDLGPSWKCRHQGLLLATTASSGTGAYSMSFTGVADPYSGCANGGSQRVDFNLATESFATTTIDGTGEAGVALYGAADYGGWAVRFDEPGAWSFTGNLAGLNDQVSSVHVDRGWKVTLYENANFTGRTMVLTADTPWIGWSFNDVTSAIVVSRE